MQIIYPDNITVIVASSENTNYPKENISDDYRGHYWAAASAVESTLTLTVSAGSNAVALSNTNSGTVTVEVKNAGGSTIYGPTAHPIDTIRPDLWVDYTLQSGVATIILTFADPGSVAPYCGAVRAGYAYTFESPQYGLTESLEDLSVTKTLNNGAVYYKKRDIVRMFSGSINIDRDTDFYTFMYTIVTSFGQRPLFWNITDINGQDWVVFARLTGMPSGSHTYYDKSTISFLLKEDIKAKALEVADMLEGSTSTTVTGTFDTGTTTIDSFEDSLGDGAIFAYTIAKSTNVRTGIIRGAWDTVADSTVQFDESSSPDVGDTSPVTFIINKSTNTVRLRAVGTSDGWSYTIIRTLM